MTNVIIFHFGPFFALLLPKQPEKSKFWENEKTPGDIIILHKCTKNYDQIMYGSWDMVRDRCNRYFSFWAIFCPLTPLTAQKIKILKKWKKHLEISSFYISVPKIMTRWCTVPKTGLEISVGHRTMTDSNNCLTDLKLLQSDIVSEKKKTM